MAEDGRVSAKQTQIGATFANAESVREFPSALHQNRPISGEILRAIQAR